MKWKKWWIMVASSALLATSAAIAENKAEHNVTITNPVQIGATQLEPGHYKVAWQGAGPMVQVQFLHDGKTVATSDAKLVNQTKKSPYDDVVTTRTNAKSASLEQIDFRNQTESLIFGNQPGS